MTPRNAIAAAVLAVAAPAGYSLEPAAECPAGDFALILAELYTAPAGAGGTCYYRGPRKALAVVQTVGLACPPCLTPPELPADLEPAPDQEPAP